MRNERFVYVMYITTTAAKVWEALISGELTRRNRKHENVSDWEPGSAWQVVSSVAKRTVKHVGRALEIVPPKRLVLSWGGETGSQDAATL
jgi:uncharacterized protein YndB with AHSA1/START domain